MEVDNRVKPTLETARLHLVPVQPDHAPGLFTIYNDAETMRYHSRRHTTIEETEEAIAEKLQWASVCPPSWTIIRKVDDAIIGEVNLIAAIVTGMGYLIRRDEWRQGYGTEAVEAILEYAFETLMINRIELWINAANIASQRLALRCGFTGRGQFYQRFPHQLAPTETWVYGLRVDEWEGRKIEFPSLPPRAHAFYGIYPEIHVPDVQAAIDFYCDKLGFDLEFTGDAPPDFAMVSRGEWTTERATLRLVRDADAKPGALYLPVGAKIDRLYAELRANGVTMLDTPHNQSYGRREFTLEDLNGWKLTFSTAV